MNNLKYVPVLRFREQERKAFSATAISNKMVPLVEIMTEKARANGRETAIEIFAREFSSINTFVMLDFPMYLKLQGNTSPTVRSFVTQLRVNPSERINLFKNPKLLEMNNLIPVITYDPSVSLQTGMIMTESQELRKHYEKLAYRIFPQNFTAALIEVEKVATEHDIIMLDIDEDPYTQSLFKTMYTQLSSVAMKTNSKKVLIRSAIPSDLTNVGLTSKQVVYSADNGLLKDYAKLGFDAFGDYVGVKKDELTKGGKISPGYLMYSWKQNCYYGFNGIIDQPATFETMVLPDTLSSTVWAEYGETHKKNCYGCQSLIQIDKGNKPGKGQAEWKGFAFGHYLYTMEEFL